MKQVPAILALLLVPGLVGAGVYWQRTQSLSAHLARARAQVGMRNAAATLAASADRFTENAELQFLAARQQTFEGKFAKAEEYLHRAGALGWPRAEVDRQHWLTLLHVDFRAAEPHLQRLRDLHPDDPELLVGLALGYLQIDRGAMAEALADRAVQIAPDEGAAYCARGRVYLRQRFRDKALRDFQEALARGPDRFYAPITEMMTLLCLKQMGRYEEGYQVAARCRAGDPDNALLLLNLGVCARYTGRSEEALEALNAVLRQQPGDTDARFELAAVYEEKHALDKALEVLKGLEAEYPEDSQLLSQLAKIYQTLGDSEQAENYQRRFRAVDKKLQQLGMQSANPAVGDRTTAPRPDTVPNTVDQ